MNARPAGERKLKLVQVDFATRQLETPIGIPLERHILDSVLGALRSEAKCSQSD
jgi:hypothetical protein